jgi:hypothetical protein
MDRFCEEELSPRPCLVTYAILMKIKKHELNDYSYMMKKVACVIATALLALFVPGMANAQEISPFCASASDALASDVKLRETVSVVFGSYPSYMSSSDPA